VYSPRSSDQLVHFREDFLIIARGPTRQAADQVRKPERRTLDQDAARAAVGTKGRRDFPRLFHSPPARVVPLSALPVDGNSPCHFVVAGLGRRQVSYRR